MQEDKVYEINTLEKVIDGFLSVRSDLENEVYELDSAINVAREYVQNKDLDFLRYLNIIGEKLEKIKQML